MRFKFLSFFKLSITFVALAPWLSQAQTVAPGGINQNIMGWWKSGNGISLSGSTVTGWDDQSNSNKDFTTTNGPSILVDDINGHDALSFDGNNDFMKVSNGIFNSTSRTDITVFVINKTNAIQSSAVFFENLSNGDRFGAHLPWSDSKVYYDYGTCCTSSRINTNWGASIGEYHLWTMGTSNTNNTYSGYKKSIHRDGLLIASNNQSDMGTGMNNDFFLGSSNGINSFHHGDVAEMLIYHHSPTAAEVQKIHTYFALKYGVPMSNNTDGDNTSFESGSGNAINEGDFVSSNGTVLWDASANSSYANHVFGIGRDDNSDLYQLSSQSLTNTELKVAINSIGSNNSFMIFGNNGNVGGITSSNTPSGYDHMLNGAWKVKKTGTIGTVDLIFNISSFFSVSANDMALVIDSDDNFTSGASTYATGTISGNTITFSNVSLNSGDYITLALNYTQNAPGGVSSNMVIWKDAGQWVSTNSGKVTQWNSAGTANVNSIAASANNRPEFKNGNGDATFNYQPYLSFDGTSDRLGVDYILSNTNVDQLSCFVVFKTEESGGSYNKNWAFLDFDRSDHFNTYLHGNGKLGFSYRTGGIEDNTGNTVLNDGVPHIGTFVYDNSVTNDMTMYADGELDKSENTSSLGDKIGKSGSRYGYIGDGSEATSLNGAANNIYYEGEIAEIIYFENASMTAVEMNKLHSYLGLKYGISLSMADEGSTASTDERNYHNSYGNVVWDYVLNSGYKNDIAGLIKDEAGNLNVIHSKSSSSDAILEMEVNQLNDTTSIVWGNDDGDFTFVNNVPNGWDERLTRIWKVEERNETGNITVSFDLTDISGAPALVDHFVLLIDSDTDFSNATEHTSGATLSGNTISFSNVNLANGEYLTLGFFTSIVWDGSNWTNGSGTGNSPNYLDSTKALNITSGTVTLPSDASVKSLDVSNSATLIVPSNKTLHVDSDIINEGLIIVENAGSLLQKGLTNSNSGTGQYQIIRSTGILHNDTRYQIWSSPVNSITIGTALVGASPANYYSYDASIQSWNHLNPGDTMQPGHGYLSTGTIGINQASEDRIFNGVANNGTFTITTTGVDVGDYILVGNPYPSAIDADVFISYNPGLTGSLSFWDQDTVGANVSDYGVWTSGGSTAGASGEALNNYIETAQGFFIQANTTNPTITFNNDMRVAGNNVQFFKQENEGFKSWFSLVNEEDYFSQIFLGMDDESTDQFDRLSDAKRVKVNTKLTLTSILNNEGFAIQSLAPLNLEEAKEIALSVDAWTTGVHTIKLDSARHWQPNLKVYFLDKVEHEKIEVQPGFSYAFNVDSAQTIDDRFFIVFENKVEALDQIGENTTFNELDSVPETDATTGVIGSEDHSVRILRASETILIESNQNIVSLHMYDIAGKLVQHTKSNSNRIELEFPANGVYIINLILNDGTQVTQRLVW